MRSRRKLDRKQKTIADSTSDSNSSSYHSPSGADDESQEELDARDIKRKKIRPIFSEDKLQASTRQAGKAELERRKRVNGKKNKSV